MRGLLHSGKSGVRSNFEKVRFQVSAATQVSGKGLICNIKGKKLYWTMWGLLQERERVLVIGNILDNDVKLGRMRTICSRCNTSKVAI